VVRASCSASPSVVQPSPRSCRLPRICHLFAASATTYSGDILTKCRRPQRLGFGGETVAIYAKRRGAAHGVMRCHGPLTSTRGAVVVHGAAMFQRLHVDAINSVTSVNVTSKRTHTHRHTRNDCDRPAAFRLRLFCEAKPPG